MSSARYLHGRFRSGAILLSWEQWTLLASIFAALLVLSDLCAPSNPIRAWYWMRLVAPAQELRYGFKAQLAADHPGVVISSVAPGASFANAGIQPGFVVLEPSCLGFGAAELFLRRLRDAPAGSLKLRFVTDGRGIDGVRPVITATVSVPTRQPAR